MPSREDWLGPCRERDPEVYWFLHAQLAIEDLGAYYLNREGRIPNPTDAMKRGMKALKSR